MAKFYAVKKGLVPGIYRSWAECQKNINGFSGAEFKSFYTEKEAKRYLNSPLKSEVGISKNDIHIEDFKCLSADKNKDKKPLIAYVAGSYNQDNNQYGYGIVLLFDGIEIRLADIGRDSVAASLRNVAGEILAAEQAMIFAAINGFKKLIIYHDYVGISKWCSDKWRANNNYTKAYKETYNKFSQKLNIKFIHVSVHSDDKYNEVANMLAKSQIF